MAANPDAYYNQPPPPPPPPQQGHAGTVVATLAGLGATILPPTPAAVGTALTVTAQAQMVGALLTALRRFQQRREGAFQDELAHEAQREAPGLDDVINETIRRELNYEASFRANQFDRAQGELPALLAIADKAQRDHAVRQLFDREARYTKQRESAMRMRVLSDLRHHKLREDSPEGAFWLLSNKVKTHTPDCVAMSNNFWPWEVLQSFKPPVHMNCACSLIGKRQAVNAGLLTSDHVVDVQGAIADASERLRLAAQALREGLYEIDLSAYNVSEQSGLDSARLGRLDSVRQGAHGPASRGLAEHGPEAHGLIGALGDAGRGAAGQGLERGGKAVPAWPVRGRLGGARHGEAVKAGRSEARAGVPRNGSARQSRTGEAGVGKASDGAAGHGVQGAARVGAAAQGLARSGKAVKARAGVVGKASDGKASIGVRGKDGLGQARLGTTRRSALGSDGVGSEGGADSGSAVKAEHGTDGLRAAGSDRASMGKAVTARPGVDGVTGTARVGKAVPVRVGEARAGSGRPGLARRSGRGADGLVRQAVAGRGALGEARMDGRTRLDAAEQGAHGPVGDAWPDAAVDGGLGVAGPDGSRDFTARQTSQGTAGNGSAGLGRALPGSRGEAWTGTGGDASRDAARTGAHGMDGPGLDGAARHGTAGPARVGIARGDADRHGAAVPARLGTDGADRQGTAVSARRDSAGQSEARQGTAGVEEGRWISRFPKGTEHGGEFKPRVGGDAGALLLKKLGLRRRSERAPELPAGRWHRIAGRQVRVPRDAQWVRRIAGSVYTSPPGTTNVYRDDRLLPTPHIDHDERDATHTLADVIRDARRQEALKRPGAPLQAGDSASHVLAMRERGYGLQMLRPAGQHTWKAMFRHHVTGATATATLTDHGVTSAHWDTAPIAAQLGKRLDHPPRNWNEHAADAVVWAADLAAKHNAPSRFVALQVDDEFEDHAGMSDFEGVSHIGKDAAPDIQRAADSRARRRELSEGEKRGVYSTYWTTAHELAHAINPAAPDEFAVDETRNLEEALAEELSHHLALERLAAQDQHDVIDWAHQHPFSPAVQGAYLIQRGNLADLLDTAKIPANELRTTLETLKFKVPVSERFDWLAAAIHDAHPHISLPEAEELARATMRDGERQGSTPRKVLAPQSPGSKKKKKGIVEKATEKVGELLGVPGESIVSEPGSYYNFKTPPVIVGGEGDEPKLALGGRGPIGTTLQTAKDETGGKWLVQQHAGDRDRVDSELLANRVYRELGIKTPVFIPVTTPGGPDFTQRPDDLKAEPELPTTRRLSAGIILVGSDGRVTLVEPRGHFGGYHHTFSKGGVDSGETAQQAAHRELWEETGLHAHIVGVLGDYEGDTGATRFYVGVRTGGVETPSRETESIETLRPKKAMEILNRGRDQDVLRDLVSSPMYKKARNAGEFKDQFPPTVPGKAIAFEAPDGSPKKITKPNAALSAGYVADALLGNWAFVGGSYGDNLLWSKGSDEPTRVNHGAAFEYRPTGGEKDYGPVPNELWEMLRRGEALGTVELSEDQMRAQAQHIADTLTPERVDELVDAGDFHDAGMRERIRDALKARVEWLGRFASGEESLPEPAEGEEARSLLLDAQDQFQLYPEEDNALTDYQSEEGRKLDDLVRDGKQEPSKRQKKIAATLDNMLNDVETPADVYAYIALSSEPGSGFAGQTIKQRSFTLLATDKALADTKGPATIRVLVPGGAHAYLDEFGSPDNGNLLLPRGARMKIGKLAKDADGRTLVDALLLPYEKPGALYVKPWSYSSPSGPQRSQKDFPPGAKVKLDGQDAEVLRHGGHTMLVKRADGREFWVPPNDKALHPIVKPTETWTKPKLFYDAKTGEMTEVPPFLPGGEKGLKVGDRVKHKDAKGFNGEIVSVSPLQVLWDGQTKPVTFMGSPSLLVKVAGSSFATSNEAAKGELSAGDLVVWGTKGQRGVVVDPKPDSNGLVSVRPDGKKANARLLLSQLKKLQENWEKYDAERAKTPEGYDPWRPGHYGKAMIADGEPYAWKVDSGELAPHHATVGRLLPNVDTDSRITINPEAEYAFDHDSLGSMADLPDQDALYGKVGLKRLPLKEWDRRYNSPGRWLRESWSDAARAGALASRRAKHGQHTLGVTPFRGAGSHQDESYYQTTRYKGFETALRRKAAKEGVTVRKLDRVRGVWQGGGEPSARVVLKDGEEGVRRVMDHVGAKYNQDAVLRFRDAADGPDARYVSEAPVDRDELERAMGESELPGATHLPDGRVELVDLGAAAHEHVAKLADRLGANFVYHPGYGELRENGVHYGRRVREDLGAASVEGSPEVSLGEAGGTRNGSDSGDVRAEEAERPSPGRHVGHFDPARHPRGRKGQFVTTTRELPDVPAARAPHESSGATGYFLGDVPLEVGLADSENSVTPPETLRAFGDAIRAEFARHPELRYAERHLRGVYFASSPAAPPGVDKADWQMFREPEYLRDTSATTFSSAFDPTQRVVINDTSQLRAGAERGWLAASTARPYGLITHELGHAYFVRHMGRWADNGALLDRHHIGPRDVRHISKYAAASPTEALAELYSMRFTPGFGLTAKLQAKFDELLDDVAKQDEPETLSALLDKYLDHVISSNPKVLAEVDRAARENVQADEWVAKTPLLDKLRGARENLVEARHGKTALIAVDVQKDFIDGSLGGQTPEAVKEREAVIGPLLEYAKTADIVVASRDWHPSDHVSFSTDPQFVDGSWPAHAVQGTPGAEIAEPIRDRADAIVSKGDAADREAYSAFDGTVNGTNEKLGDWLRERGVDHVIVGGIATDYCVRSTALDAAKQGFDTDVATDAIAGVAPDTSRMAMGQMLASGVRETTRRGWGEKARERSLEVRRARARLREA